MDLVDIIAEKRFLGQEFLTWLWFRSEERGGTVYLPDVGDIQIEFVKHILLESGEAESLEKLICRGQQAELKEARTGLRLGKKVEQARIRLARGEYEWHLTLGATLLEVRSLKLPRTMTSEEESTDPAAVEGRVLERLSLIEEAVGLVNELYRQFLLARTDHRWDEELARVRNWVERGGGS